MNTTGITFLITKIEKQRTKYLIDHGYTSIYKKYIDRAEAKIKELKEIKKEWESLKMK